MKGPKGSVSKSSRKIFICSVSSMKHRTWESFRISKQTEIGGVGFEEIKVKIQRTAISNCNESVVMTVRNSSLLEMNFGFCKVVLLVPGHQVRCVFLKIWRNSAGSFDNTIWPVSKPELIGYLVCINTQTLYLFSNKQMLRQSMNPFLSLCCRLVKMELPGSVGSADFVRPTNNKGQETVTLISYNSNKFKPKENSDRGYIHRFVQNQATNNYVVSSNAATSQCKKFNFRQGFRKRSKSASRLEENLKGSRSASVSQTNLADLDDTITYRKDTQQDLHQNLSRAESSQVQLVGFSQCNSEFAGTSNQNSLVVDREKSSNHNSRFQTLKTSREVKMERERLRQEKLHRLTQVNPPHQLLKRRAMRKTRWQRAGKIKTRLIKMLMLCKAQTSSAKINDAIEMHFNLAAPFVCV